MLARGWKKTLKTDIKMTTATPVLATVHSLFSTFFSSVQSLSLVQLFVTPWTAAHQASLSITNSWSLPKLMSIELVMPPSIKISSLPLPGSGSHPALPNKIQIYLYFTGTKRIIHCFSAFKLNWDILYFYFLSLATLCLRTERTVLLSYELLPALQGKSRVWHWYCYHRAIWEVQTRKIYITHIQTFGVWVSCRQWCFLSFLCLSLTPPRWLSRHTQMINTSASDFLLQDGTDLVKKQEEKPLLYDPAQWPSCNHQTGSVRLL